MIKKITVLGAGTMGSGIAAICLKNGFEVAIFDPFEEALAKAKERCLKRTDEQTVSEKLSLTTELIIAAKDADFVIEAVPEKLELKRSLFADLDEICPEHCILASNTSELSLTAIAGATKRPEKVIGMHWFNPPERMDLIEIVMAVQTNSETLAITKQLAHKVGKTTVVVKDRQGFVTTRALASLLLEAMRMLEEGVATKEDIDTAIKLGLNHPMGPLELADYVGLDTMLLISESMNHSLGERFLAPQTLRKLVEANHLGRKTGQGFYSYESKR